MYKYKENLYTVTEKSMWTKKKIVTFVTLIKFSLYFYIKNNWSCYECISCQQTTETSQCLCNIKSNIMHLLLKDRLSSKETSGAFRRELRTKISREILGALQGELYGALQRGLKGHFKRYSRERAQERNLKRETSRERELKRESSREEAWPPGMKGLREREKERVQKGEDFRNLKERTSGGRSE